MSSTEKARAALAANPFPPSLFVQVTDDAIVIKSGFSEQLLQLLRWVPNVQWRPEKRCWTVPLSGAGAVRAVLPEILRLAEATQPPRDASEPAGVDASQKSSAQDLFRKAARLAFGGDWQRDSARALNRDEAALARWLAGERELEDPQKLLRDMIEAMRRHAAEIAAEADRLAASSDRAADE
jgi:hypothetical protein